MRRAYTGHLVKPARGNRIRRRPKVRAEVKTTKRPSERSPRRGPR